MKNLKNFLIVGFLISSLPSLTWASLGGQEKGKSFRAIVSRVTWFRKVFSGAILEMTLFQKFKEKLVGCGVLLVELCIEWRKREEMLFVRSFIHSFQHVSRRNGAQ